ncbi:MAG: ferrochelatase [Alphaproteobacteria bacterium]
MARVAVVLFNLGGPDKPDSVEPFLFNLFSDPAILRVPGFVRWFLARLISRRRAPVAREIYAQLGGGSPILPNTQAQARALETALQDTANELRCFIAMRYWHPFAAEAARAVKEFSPDEIVLLPLYAQFSTTTTASSLEDWQRAARDIGLNAPSRTLCCYPDQPGYIAALAAPIAAAVAATPSARVLFSAHGLPEKIVRQGDPYQWQVERTARAVVEQVNKPELDWLVCYQSRVGPLKWLGPSTEDEIKRAGAEKKPLIVVPIAFVSEHSETLVELDIEYRHVAEQAGVPSYTRLPTVSADPAFIAGLADLVRAARKLGPAASPAGGTRLCPPEFAGCVCRAGG